jgi:hypothetical protein
MTLTLLQMFHSNVEFIKNYELIIIFIAQLNVILCLISRHIINHHVVEKPDGMGTIFTHS